MQARQPTAEETPHVTVKNANSRGIAICVTPPPENRR